MDGVGLAIVVGLDVGLSRVGGGAAGRTELRVGGPVGTTAPEVAHQELVVPSIVVVERPAVSYPEEQKANPLTLESHLVSACFSAEKTKVLAKRVTYVVMTQPVGIGCRVEDAATVALGGLLLLSRPETLAR